MEMSGEVRIAAPRAKVWAALNDPEILRVSIPGCTALAKVSDTEMTATVNAKLGMVRATFTGAVTLSNIDPPKGYTISGEGKGGVAGFASGGADVNLIEDGASTILKYTARGQVGGKIAQIGARLIDATAKQMADQFFTAFAAKVSDRPLERIEHVVEDAAHTVAETVQSVEVQAENAAIRGFLGGPMMWGMLAIVAGVVLIIIFR